MRQRDFGRDAAKLCRIANAKWTVVSSIFLLFQALPALVLAGGLVAAPDIGPAIAGLTERGAINQVNELSKRRRLTTFFFNEQSPFYGVQINYVNVARGNLTFANRDLVRLDKIPIVVGRVYDSQLTADAEFGAGWKLSVAEFIRRDDASLIYVDASGSEYVLEGEGTRFSSTHPHLTGITQVQIQGNEIELHHGELIKRFRRNGARYLLQEVRNDDGDWIKLQYDAGRIRRISSSHGRFVEIGRDVSGRITAATDDTGRQVSYAYDAAGRLAAYTDLGQARWKMSYDERSLLVGITDPRGSAALVASHDDHSRVSHVTVLHDSMSFDFKGAYTTVQNALQQSAVFWHDLSGLTRSAKDFAGEITELQFDERLRPAALSFNGSVVAQLGYGTDGQLRTVVGSVDSPRSTTTISYDQAGRLSNVQTDERIVARYGYDDIGNLVSAEDARGIRSYSYGPGGVLRRLTVGSVGLDLQFDEIGLLTEFASASQRTYIGYDRLGRVDSLRFVGDRSQTESRYTYSKFGLRLGGSYRGSGSGYGGPPKTVEASLEFGYDVVGNLTGLTRTYSNGTSSSQTYVIGDKNEVNKLVNGDGSAVTYDYDSAGRVARIVLGSREARFDYDSLGRLSGASLNRRQLLGSNYGPMDVDVATEADGRSALTTISSPVASAIFGTVESIAYARTRGAPFGAIRFDATMARFVLASAAWQAPDTLTLASLKRRALPLPGPGHHGSRKEEHAGAIDPGPIGFDKPSNGLFLPAELSSLNCYLCGTYPTTLDAVTATINGTTAPVVNSIGDTVTAQTGWSGQQPLCWNDYEAWPGQVITNYYTPWVTVDFRDGTALGGQLGAGFQHAYTTPAVYRVQIGASCDCEGPQYSVVLERQVTVMPRVSLSFRNSGGLSADNGNTLLAQLGISSLGLINSPSFRNVEEVQGTIAPSGFQGATYDLKRVFKAPGEVIANGTVTTSIPAGSSDDNSNNDEDLTPQNDHIYGIDAPTPGIAPNSAGTEGSTVVQRAKFTEWAECTLQGTTSKCSNDLDWCFAISLKYSGGAWMRDPAGTNVIQAGSSCY